MKGNSLTKLSLRGCHQPFLLNVDSLHAVGVFRKGKGGFLTEDEFAMCCNFKELWDKTRELDSNSN